MMSTSLQLCLLLSSAFMDGSLAFRLGADRRSNLLGSARGVGTTTTLRQLNGEGINDPSDDNMLASTSRLSHVMLKVPSVDASVDYWTSQGGYVSISRKKEDGPGLMSAFVALGHSSGASDSLAPNKCAFDKTKCFSMELVQAKDTKNYLLGNAIAYIGVSMLLQFQNNLLGAITGEKPEDKGEEPNGIQIKASASAPGDLLCRLAFHSTNLEATCAFYTQVLGMKAMAQDSDMLCLRYDPEDFPGVATTLVFEKVEEDIVVGDCFDHLAIATSFDIDVCYQQIKGSGDTQIFMKPVEMFGKKVMGVIDPNGYKVVLASE